MFKPKDYAFQIKTNLNAIFDIESEKFGLGLISNIDFIEKNPFIPITMILGNYYNKLEKKSKTQIDDFIETYSWLMDKSIEEIGEEKIKRIISEFNSIVATV
jgi:hypothetical protein